MPYSVKMEIYNSLSGDYNGHTTDELSPPPLLLSQNLTLIHLRLHLTLPHVSKTQQVDDRSTRALHDTGSRPVLYINIRQFDTTRQLVGRPLAYIYCPFLLGGGEALQRSEYMIHRKRGQNAPLKKPNKKPPKT